MLRLEVKPYILHFKFSAKTSRGELDDRQVWFLHAFDEKGQVGIGEVAPIDRLSPESLEEVPAELEELSRKLRSYYLPESESEVYALVAQLVSEDFPSIRFGLEVALLDLLNNGKKVYFNRELDDIELPINGLIWMGNSDFMREQIEAKLDEGFRCIKMKVGALDFETEVSLIRDLRAISDELVIRLDANGGFRTQDVLRKLKELSKHKIHSIEQPIMPSQPEAMALVCDRSDIPIALDEELIGIYGNENRLGLLQDIKPQFLVLKPTLHGGISSVSDWIDLASIQGVDWWLTSYLESNIGLNAIAQFAAKYPSNVNYHGLGTGGLYHNNITSPIQIQRGHLKYAASKVWGIAG